MNRRGFFAAVVGLVAAPLFPKPEPKYRLICRWRGRTVLKDMTHDPQNIFMSKVGDPTNWEVYLPRRKRVVTLANV